MSQALPPSAQRRVYDDISGAIGHTPLVRLNRVARGLPCPIYAKLEMLNPGGSVKDRIAFTIIDAFEKTGELKPGGTVVEATSGNTGVGLAIACSLGGYQAVFVMPDKMSQEKIDMLRAFGARVVITPTSVAPDDPRSYYSVADRIVEETPNAILANQYHNPANPQSHYQTTAPEIWDQTEGKVTDIVAGLGTGGTVTGIARYYRDHNRKVKIVGVDPRGSILYDAWKAGGKEEGLEAFTYKVEGIGEDFVPSTLDLSLIDDIIQVDDTESFLWTRRLVREEGLFCGGSSGAALAGAVNYAQGLSPDRLVVVILPDSGSRYLSKVFDDHWMRQHGFLEVDRRRVTVQEVVQARGPTHLITATPGDPMSEVIALMREFSVSQLPVVEEDGSLVGIVSEVELLNHLLASDKEHEPEKGIDSAIDRDIQTAPVDSPLDEVLPELLARKVVILVDQLNQPQGILTIIDALEFIASTA